MYVSDRISFKLARLTVVIALTVGLFLSLGQAVLDYEAEEQQLQARVAGLLEVSRDAATHSVEVIDPRLAQKVAEGFLASSFVAEARIVDEKGELLASARNDTVQDAGAPELFSDTFQDYAIDLVLPQGVADTNGRLTLTINRGIAFKPFYERAVTDLIWGFIRSLLLATILYFAFHNGVTRPLTTVVDEVSNINPDQPGEQRITPPPNHENDELGKLVRQVNQSLDAVQVLVDNLRSTNRALTSSEEALRRRSWELEQEVDRTKETTLELLATKEQAEAANRAKSVFLANVSHELRTPLNAIIGFSSIMSEQMFGPLGHKRYREYLEDIRSSSEHLSDVLGQVLDLAKIEAGQMKLEEEAVDLQVLCEESIALISGQASMRGLEISFAKPDVLPTLWGDRLRIKQSVLNLLSNAVKFTPEKGDPVELTVDVADHGGIMIAVTDHGIGIADEEKEMVFSPFIRSSSALSRSHEGTGLGLSLVKAFLDKHDGWITLDSTLGEGATFVLHFPKERVMPEDDNLDTSPANLGSAAV